MDTLTYKDIKNLNKEGSSQLLPLPTDIKETHEAISAEHVWKISTEFDF